jgi:hypothetical protein
MTRLYFRPESILTPRSNAGWDAVHPMTNYARWGGLEPTKGVTFEQPITASITVTNATDILQQGYISRPILYDQDISGTVRGQVVAFEGATTMNLMSQMKIYLTDNDGVVKSTIYAGTTAALASEFPLASQNRKIPHTGVTSISSVSALAGDRVLVQVGFRSYGSATGSAFLTIGGSGTDLPEDETTASGVAWVQFSSDIWFDTETFEPFEGSSDWSYPMFPRYSQGSRAWYGEELEEGATVPPPTTGQIWPRGNLMGG